MNGKLKSSKDKKEKLSVNVDELNDAIQTLNQATSLSKKIESHKKTSKVKAKV